MPIPDRKKLPTEDPQLEWIVTDDGSRTLRNVSLDETYHSGCGAVTECWYVYLENSGVLERCHKKLPTNVLEYGFGTGTSFWLTASVAEAYQAELTYIAFENELLPYSVLEQTLASQELRSHNASQPSLEEIHKAGDRIRGLLLSQFREFGLSGGKVPKFLHCKLTDYVSLLLCSADAKCVDWREVEHAILGRQSQHEGRASYRINCDAIYFDPFSPDTNPDLWTAEVFEYAKQRLAPHGKLVSYCVKGSVRRTLESVGFQVDRVPGPPGGKREVLSAHGS